METRSGKMGAEATAKHSVIRVLFRAVVLYEHNMASGVHIRATFPSHYFQYTLHTNISRMTDCTAGDAEWIELDLGQNCCQ